ncbi:hypothetical protein VC83_04663 [Pseudogymnoascus destructans]|uniref:SEC7 domain-containing protein n=2 Tax=Pseudogymnoascus destructans TaxID=655981 RepID=L8G8H5_PSED2|nr:uncharacterized protein VC83_04663 [Pseudogymnoascus destructans]ELR08326.1 hypothetical protein GMDG_03121 [Pseudogymnoascus destructans 20631-21]OAF57270.1 hypothetical protein VC83_04663 [Pseudogymnoascus destructans]
MDAYDNMPTSPSRRAAGVTLTLNTNTTSNTSAYRKPRDPNLSPPRTPPGTRSRRALRERDNNTAPAAVPRETFLDDSTPVDFAQPSPQARRGDGERHSHDLSLAPEQVTRDSLVNNMLLSLDQFSLGGEGGGGFGVPGGGGEGLYNSFGAEEEHGYAGYDIRRGNGGGLGHGHSFSEDFDHQDAASRASSQYTRTRRSNSSSNYTTTTTGRHHASNSGSVGTPRQAPQSPGAHPRERKESKDRNVSSSDMGHSSQTGSSQRWALGYGNRGRALSFDDYGQEAQMGPLQRQRTHSSPVEELEPYDIYDAAPTPTVPVGPRRQRPITPNGVYTADISTPSPKTRNLQSSRAPKTLYQKRAETSHGQGNPMNNGMDENRRLAAMPALMKEEPAPAPLVAYGKVKNVTAPTSGSKPGFFRRVFGSKGNTPGAASTGSVSSPGSTISGDPMERPPSNKYQNQTAERVRTAHGYPPPQPPPQRSQKEAPKAISKKPSSFFKRRKKSVSEPEVPAMPLQLVLVRGQEVGQDLASPTSSLRQVMNQYLNSPITQPPRWDDYDAGRRYGNGDDDESIEETTGFSPGYTPDKSATIRSVNPGRRDAEPRRAPLMRNNTSQSQLDTDNEKELDRTSLQDNSDNDKEGNRTVSQTLTVKADPASRDMAHSPNSVARDKALVAEYEQKYSRRQPARKAENPMLSLYPTSGGSPKSKKDEGASDNGGTVRGKGRAKGAAEQDAEKTSSISLPLEGMKGVESSESSPAVFYSATSLAGGEGMTLPTTKDAYNSSEPSSAVDQVQPTTGDWERAKKIYDGNEDFIQQSKAAAWLGEDGAIRRRTLLAYMELYDFKDMDILGALRALCNRLVLKAESQQVDRILDTFATRWCQCNPHHGFKITDVVHTICYSILLLNTDLHLADIESKMTKSQFVKNTIPTILRVVADAAPEAFVPSRPTILSPKFGVPEPDNELRHDLGDNMRALRGQANAFEPEKQLTLRPAGKSLRPGSMGPSVTGLNQQSPAVDDCGPLVCAQFQGTLKAWEGQVEIVLKDFYNGIRNERLPLFGAPAEQPRLQQASQSSLSVFGTNKLRRTPSIVSKAGSESMSFFRGRTADSVRLNTGKWTNKHRSRPRVYPHSTMGSSRTSLDDQSSIWSPSQSSSTWSKYSLGKTQTSMLSVNSLDSDYPQGDYQQSIGFANALSQAIIREEHVGSPEGKGEDVRVTPPLLEDESLELHGAPWAKEGIVKHKHHLEAADKKAKDRNWAEVFVVIEKGYMSLFSFSSKSVRHKSSSRAKAGAGGVVVGGGNWQDNAENLGSFLLRQTIASMLPSPGYSKARPHVFALSLPTGAVHLFQVGTPEIVKEFVSTANYWSARLSNHPLVGGISNIEYGWSDAVINNSLVSAIQDAHPTSPPTTGTGMPTTTAGGGIMGGGRAASISGPRPSLQSSLRSSLDQGAGFKARLPGDKITISEWAPPTQSMRASCLEEGEQLGGLEEYVRGVEEELVGHNRLRGAMILAFTPRAPNAHRAMANWERKSSYLLREIVKFRTYIDCLLAARALKEKIYREREERKGKVV